MIRCLDPEIFKIRKYKKSNNTLRIKFSFRFYANFSDDTNNEMKDSLMQTAYIRKVSIIQDQFVKALQIHLSQHENGARLTDILTWYG